MGIHNEHRRQDCRSGADGCWKCLDSPPKGLRSRAFELSEGGDSSARVVVDRPRNLVSYQIDTGARTVVLFPSDLDAVRALLATLDAEERAAIDAARAEEGRKWQEEFDRRAEAHRQTLLDGAPHDEDECPRGGCGVCENTCSIGGCHSPRRGPGDVEFLCISHDSF